MFFVVSWFRTSHGGSTQQKIKRSGVVCVLIKLLGAGGMGAVYQARDSELSVTVALKVILGDARRGSVSAELERRFKNELLLARQVTHKHVVRIHDLGEIDGIKYITMPYVQGDNLATVLRRDDAQTCPTVGNFEGRFGCVQMQRSMARSLDS